MFYWEDYYLIFKGGLTCFNHLEFFRQFCFKIIFYIDGFGVAEEIYVVHKSRSYFAFNKKTPDSIVKKWQYALDDLRKDGTVLNILKKYKLESLYPK